MPAAGDEAVIDSTARLARNGIVAVLAQLILIIGTLIYQIPPFQFIRRPGADHRAAQGAAAGKVADANEAARRAKWQASRVAVRSVWITVAITALVLPLSFVGPALMTRRSRRGIVAWTWPPPSFKAPKPFTAQVLESDTGKLAFLYVVEFGIGLTMVAFAIVLVPFGYFLSGGHLIVLGAAVVLIATAAARFPTRGRIVCWIARQQDLLNHERKQTRVERQQEVLDQKKHKTRPRR